MKSAGFAVALALLLAVFAPSQRAQAGSYFSFGLYGPGYYGHHHHHYYRDYYPYYSYQPRYYRPYRSYRSYRPRGGTCAYWSQRCTENWGYGNNNYYGCMRYYDCD